MATIKNAVISVFDKTGLVEFANFMRGYGVTIISTGGTGRALHAAGIPYKDISEVTGFPEIMDGRVKTLHPLLHGGILARRDLDSHRKQMREYKIEPIDLVVVNLYPFEKVVAERPVRLQTALENIDVGGPTMIRAAAKNYPYLLVLVSPEQYTDAMDHLKKNKGTSTLDYRFQKACEAFLRTADYERHIIDFLSGVETSDPESMIGEEELKLPEFITWYGSKVSDLRYGENPHQVAALYIETAYKGSSLVTAEKLQGKELSFNNIMDFEAAWKLCWEFDQPASAIIKHTNPCGVAIGENLKDAYSKAKETDPDSAFGSVIAFNRQVDKDTAVEIVSIFVEGIIAPEYTADAIDIFAGRKNIRVLKLGKPISDEKSFDFKKIIGGMLLQTTDDLLMDEDKMKVVTKRKPTEEEREAMLFGWKVVKHVKSNAIVYARRDRTVGIGAGQMSRVDSARIGIMKARISIKDSIIASDAFFPFRDSVDAAAEVGVTAIIQPGGSIRDEEVIAAADEHNHAMIFTGIRHFRH